ncbi:hypothetical protein ABIB35_003733 [Arthrobacter sp. UYP6]
MSFEKLAFFAQGDNNDGGNVILFVALVAVALLVVFIWKSFKRKGAPDAKTVTLEKPKTNPKMKPAMTAEEVVSKRCQPQNSGRGMTRMRLMTSWTEPSGNSSGFRRKMNASS